MFPYFPICIGSIDGEHVRIVKPYCNGSLFYNYKNYISIVLIDLVHSNYHFLYVDFGAYWKDSNSNVVKKFAHVECTDVSNTKFLLQKQFMGWDTFCIAICNSWG